MSLLFRSKLDKTRIQSVDLNALLSVAASAIGVSEPLEHWQAREITVETNPPQTVECDGEIIESTPLTASVLPQAIRVMVPDITNLSTPNGSAQT